MCAAVMLKVKLNNGYEMPVIGLGTNEVECHPGLNQKILIQFCKERYMTLTASCPIDRHKFSAKTPDLYFSGKTKAIANKYQKTTTQIIFRFLVDFGAVPIPRSSNADKILENFDIFDLTLAPEEIEVMESFNTGERLVTLARSKDHKCFPYNIEY